jgi:hypothetical protein
MDVVSVYLLGDLEEEAYIKVPKGLEVLDLTLGWGTPPRPRSGVEYF